MTFLFCLAAIASSFVRADSGAATKYVLPDGRVVYSDRPVPGGKRVKEIEQVPDRGASSDSRLTPFEKNATLPELAGTDRLDLIKDRLARGADPNAVGKYPRLTPLQAAAAGGRAETVHLLLRAGADPNLVPPKSHGGPPLCAAAAGASGGHAEVTRLLLKHGARPNDKCIDGYGPTPLMRAADTGNPESVRALLAAGADVNVVDWSPNSFPRRDTTALMYAAMAGQYEAVKLLVGAGAKVDAKMLPDNRTALWLAADGRFAADGPSRRDYAGIARELLEHGADVSAAPTSDPRTPLLVAATKNSANFVKVLLESGANANERDQEGQSPLMHAAMRGDVEMIAALIKKGADPNVTDKYGRSAFQLANTLGFSEATRLLAGLSAAQAGGAVPQVQEVAKPLDAEPRTLNPSWQYEAPSGVARGPFLVEDVVLVSAWNGVIAALDASTGREIWKLQIKGTITVPPLVLGGVLYFGGEETQDGAGKGAVYALELRSGNSIWSRTFSAAPRQLMVSGQMVVVLNNNADLISLDVRSGRTVWQESAMGVGAVISGTTIVGATREGNLRALDIQTGREMWNLTFARSEPKAVQFREEVLRILPQGEAQSLVQLMAENGLYVLGIGVCEAVARGGDPRQIENDFAQFYGQGDCTRTS